MGVFVDGFNPFVEDVNNICFNPCFALFQSLSLYHN